MKKINGWYNGFNLDVDVYEFEGYVWFRVWRDNSRQVAIFTNLTLGM